MSDFEGLMAFFCDTQWKIAEGADSAFGFCVGKLGSPHKSQKHEEPQSVYSFLAPTVLFREVKQNETVGAE